ncbi:hypothetical protein PPL_11205 [Heterostelium album PN500]|uniref:Autophagy-related protein 27 n=1 Tax=Heterostelium pallidum (strain ATCC 26659 / Pp 5 / PN500) TaxID=670386 RepID=D3BTU5_HETP5|nr:hypothetical protein PPL_11205 [Heterostelium album PN500]EFA75131.1 hypothetical protein PPL_11205 [Heterostelium album PN500]|eukprot:XP_020427265.1 hypothetical protein PPL_11205 [Heterostelium album PN500]
MKIIISLLLVAVTIFSVASAAAQCTFANGSDKYDFSAMKNTTGYTFKPSNTLGAATYYWNVCDICQQCATSEENTVSCQVSGGAWRTIGLLTDVQFTAITDQPNVKGATITYGGGPNCSNGQARTSRMRIQCSESETQIVSVSETSCIYDIFMTSKHACPGGGGSSSGGSGGKKGGIGGGWVFIIILLVSITVYIGVGIGVNYKVRGLRGAEMFPNIEFWRSVPGYVADGAIFIKGKITGSGGQSGYQQV